MSRVLQVYRNHNGAEGPPSKSGLLGVASSALNPECWGDRQFWDWRSAAPPPDIEPDGSEMGMGSSVHADVLSEKRAGLLFSGILLRCEMAIDADHPPAMLLAKFSNRLQSLNPKRPEPADDESSALPHVHTLRISPAIA